MNDRVARCLPTSHASVFLQVMEHEEFLLLPLNQLIEICSSDELNVRSEEQVYHAVMNWVNHDRLERRQHLPVVRRWTWQ